MLSLLAGALMALEPPVPPPVPREFRGVWIATVDNVDWPSRPGLPFERQKAELANVLRTVAACNFNAVLFQVRPHCDAVYESKLEPSSWYVTGEQGKPLGWDPLAYVVKEGHRLGLEVHAWFNPFRAVHPAQKGPYAGSHVSVSQPGWVRQYGKFGWLDPGESAARQWSLKVFLDVLDRYDVDGIHIDDYFYPYRQEGVEFPDDASYSEYRAGGGRLSRSDWRRANVDGFVQTLYDEIKKRKPWVKFGISPFGIFRPGVPKGIKAGVDQYEDLGADARKWLREGWCDYMSPQLYWKVEAPYQPFGKLLDWWEGENVKGRHLWPGLYTGRISPKADDWPVDEISRQIKLARSTGRATGQVQFSAKAIVSDWKGVQKEFVSGVYAKKALVPASPWLGGERPPAPKLDGGDGRVTWEGTARFYAVWGCVEGEWTLLKVTDATSFVLPGGTSPPPQQVAVTAIGKSGAESEPAVLSLSRSAR